MGTPLPVQAFQSTPPARGATQTKTKLKGVLDISIHAPREGGDGTRIYTYDNTGISIHAPREGGDSFLLSFFV